jgi:hypothetical protein
LITHHPIEIDDLQARLTRKHRKRLRDGLRGNLAAETRAGLSVRSGNPSEQ